MERMRPGREYFKEQEKQTVGRLAEFDSEYFEQLEGENGWIAIGQEFCQNPRYFTAENETGEKLGVVGMYDTAEDDGPPPPEADDDDVVEGEFSES